MKNLTHLNKKNQASMVDIGAKAQSERTAVAMASVILPLPILNTLNEGELISKKGSVFQTAIIAGTMAAKKTSDLIPLCHLIGLENCNIKIEAVSNQQVDIICKVSVFAKTGVEMEALTGASIAALTIYDMCKSMSHHIEIKKVRLVKKTGGKKDFFSE